jgi:hypothetical protein
VVVTERRSSDEESERPGGASEGEKEGGERGVGGYLRAPSLGGGVRASEREARWTARGAPVLARDCGQR